MKIGLYWAEQSIEGGGLFTYAIGLLKLLLNSNEIEKIALYYYTKSQENYLVEYLNKSKIIPVLFNANSKIWRSTKIFSSILSKIYIKLPKKYKFINKLSLFFNPYYRMINSNKIDIFHVPFPFSPIYGIKIPVISTMHDVQELHYPEFFTSQERLNRASGFKKAIEESSQVIVSVNCVKKDLLKYFEISKNKVSVCPLPFADDWFSSNTYTSMENLKIKYNLPENFIFYPAATWQHKNHINLLKALSLIKENERDIFLVCTGSKKQFFEKIINAIISLNIKENVKFLGVVPEEDLIGLYKSTKLVVIPTLFEAESQPLFEAMRYNVPVICSDVTSLPESISNDEFVFDPNNPEEISRLIEKGCFDEEFRNRNIENSKKRISYYKNQNYINNFIVAYNKALISTK